MSTRLEMQNISQCFGRGDHRVTALEGISLTLTEGEFLAIQGPSGSGKSSLLNICGLIDQASDGQLLINGKLMDALSEQQRTHLRRRDIGFIFQRHQLIPAMTVYENVAYPLLLNGEKSTYIKRAVNELLQRIGLAHRRKHLPKQLSGGECQRVGIARALIKQPQLVIADEPSANLDHKSAHASLMLMRELNQQQGASFMIASHDRFVIEHCDRTIHLLDGKLQETS